MSYKYLRHRVFADGRSWLICLVPRFAEGDGTEGHQRGWGPAGWAATPRLCLGANQAESGNTSKFGFAALNISLGLFSPSSDLWATDLSKPQSNKIWAVSQPGGVHTSPSRTAAPASSYLTAAKLLSLQDWALPPCLTWSWQTLSSRSICVIDSKTDALTANPLATQLQFRLIKIWPVLPLADGTLAVAKSSSPPASADSSGDQSSPCQDANRRKGSWDYGRCGAC